MAQNSNTSFRPGPGGHCPQVDPTAYIDPSAQLIGNVHIGPEVFIGPNAVIRADEADSEGNVRPIKIGARCNVQDGVIVHALGGTEVTIDECSSLSHGCIIHGPCTIGAGCFIGFRTVVYQAALADGVFVSAAATIQSVDLAANSFVQPAAAILTADDIATKLTTTTQADQKFMKKIIKANRTLTKEYINLNS